MEEREPKSRQPVKLTEDHSFFWYLAKCTPMGRIQASACFIFVGLIPTNSGPRIYSGRSGDNGTTAPHSFTIRTRKKRLAIVDE
jgi:hypothetical protein